MSSKPKASALQTLTNAGGKRQAEGADGTASVAKKIKLKSHTRTLSTEEAKRVVAGSDAKIKAQNKIIRDKQKEIRELKKKLKEAEGCLSTAKAAKAKIEAEKVQAAKMTNTDADLIVQKVTTSLPYLLNETLGRDTMGDMIALGNEADVLKLADMLGGKEETLRGALDALVSAHKSKQSPASTYCPVLSPELCPALKRLYLPLLEGKIKPISSPQKTWPLVASAMGVSADTSQEEYDLLANAVLEAAEQMKKQTPFEYGIYREYNDYCPIIDILVPTHNAINDLERVPARIAKARVWGVIRKALLESVTEVPKVVNHSMPKEAEIAGKKGFPELQRFLLSPTETSLSLNLSKAGRMEVHRLIDYQLPHGKLTHRSEGAGRSRYLVIRKANSAPQQMKKKRQERKQKHEELLSKYVYLTVSIALPPEDVKLGFTLHDNTEMGLPELKGVAPNSPVREQIPAQLHQDCCIASLKSEAIGQVRPKSTKECVMFIGQSRQQSTTGKLEIILVPLKEIELPGRNWILRSVLA